MVFWYIEDVERFGVGYEKTETIKIKKTKIMEKGILIYAGMKCGAEVCKHMGGCKEIISLYALEDTIESKVEKGTIKVYIEERIGEEMDTLYLRSPITLRGSALIWSKIIQFALLIATVVLVVKEWYGKHNFNAIIISYMLLFLVIAVEVGRLYIYRINRGYYRH